MATDADSLRESLRPIVWRVPSLAAQAHVAASCPALLFGSVADVQLSIPAWQTMREVQQDKPVSPRVPDHHPASHPQATGHREVGHHRAKPAAPATGIGLGQWNNVG